MTQRALLRTKPRLVQIGADIPVDACEEEQHSLTNQATDHPVEEGGQITDHVRPDPDKLTLKCFVSNTPFSEEQVQRAVREGNFQFNTTAGQAVKIGAIDGRAAKVYQRLKKLRDEGTLVQIITTLCTYGVKPTEGMVVTDLTIPRTNKNYDGLEWQIGFKKIRIVRNRATRQVQAKDPRAGKRVSTGNQTPKPEDFDSAAFKAANSDTVNNMTKSDNGFVKNTGNFLQSVGRGPGG